MGKVKTVLHWIWRGLDGLRKFLHLVLLLALFGFLIGVLHQSLPTVPMHAALVVAPQGRLVEQLSGNAIERAIENARGEGQEQTLLWSLTDAIRAAATDSRIRVLVLDLDQMGHAGLPELEELASAIRKFRASGKPVIAYGTAFDQDQYYVAAQANQIYLDPSGYVMIRGFGNYPMYFKGLLKKLGVKVNVFRIGKFKSAVEIFTRSDMSKADRLQSTDYLDTLWSTYQREVTAARKLPSDAIAQYVDSLPKALKSVDGDGAKLALKDHLVTGLADSLQVERLITKLVGAGPDGAFNAISAEDYADVVRAQHRLHRDDGEPRIGVIVASGEILDGEQPPGVIGGESLSRLIRKARLDKHIKAVVLRVDSPGGSVTAAEQIYQQLEALRAAGKPLVVSMGDLAASGGYYISAPANEIWASPATLTGSIGIFAIIPTFNQGLKKLGITSDGVGTTPLANQFTVDQPLNSEARDLIRSQIDQGYQQFVARVAAGRHESRARINAIGQGRVWAGADAQRIGLVDHLGTLEDAERAAARLAKVKHYYVQFIHPRVSWTQELVQRAQSRAVSMAASLFGPRLFSPRLRFPGLSALAGPLGPYARQLAQLARFSGHGNGKLYAYCFCSVR